MKSIIDRLSPFESKKFLNVVVETPKGSRIKYAFDSPSGLFQVKKALPEGMMFPFNFGFIPSTKAEDGDPLDILILNEESLVPGCLLRVEPIAVIKAEQTEKGETKAIRNDRLIGIAINKESPDELDSINLNKKILSQLEFFFVAYNKLEGKKFKVLGNDGPKAARKIIQNAEKAYRKEKKSE
jgi:inorganic pyrophosphatase